MPWGDIPLCVYASFALPPVGRFLDLTFDPIGPSPSISIPVSQLVTRDALTTFEWSDIVWRFDKVNCLAYGEVCLVTQGSPYDDEAGSGCGDITRAEEGVTPPWYCEV